jgi:hypothetical protein
MTMFWHELDDSGQEFAQRRRAEAAHQADAAGMLLAEFAINNKRLPTPAEQAAIDHLAQLDQAIADAAPVNNGEHRNVALARLVFAQTIEFGPASG